MKSVESPKVVVTDDLIKDLDTGKVKMTDLDKSTFEAVEKYIDELPEAGAGDEPAPQPKQEVFVQQDESPKNVVPGEKYKAKADEASDYKNKWMADRKRLQELEAKLAEKEKEPIQAPSVEKVWTDEHQTEIAKKVEALQRKLESYESTMSSQIESERASIKERMDDADFKMLGSQFKDLAVDEPLSKLEQRYADFYYKVGATQEDSSAVKRFFEDQAFRQEMEGKGVKAPKDFDKINEILQVKALRDKLQVADPDIKLSDAYALHMSRTNKLKSLLSDTYLQGAAQVADKIHNSANETITMQPGLTSAQTQDGWSEAQMADWLEKHPHPKTKDEVATFKRIEALLDSRAGI